MSGPALPRFAVVLIVAVAAIGVVDAAIGSTWDLVVLFSAIAGLAALVTVRSWTGRRHVSVRADLAGWMTQRAAAGGERVDDVVDRAVAAYRAGLLGDDDVEEA